MRTGLNTMIRMAALTACGAGMFLTACNDRPPDTPTPKTTANGKPSPWRGSAENPVIGLDEAANAELAAAIAQARATAETARQTWAAATPDDRKQWWVKWAAPTADERIEHVWVQPVNWSPFRVEGVLASQPLTQLECEHSLGELVSFPIEELSDWVHLLAPPTDQNALGSFDGGFTVKALEGKFGPPPMQQ